MKDMKRPIGTNEQYFELVKDVYHQTLKLMLNGRTTLFDVFEKVAKAHDVKTLDLKEYNESINYEKVISDLYSRTSGLIQAAYDYKESIGDEMIEAEAMIKRKKWDMEDAKNISLRFITYEKEKENR